MFGLWDRKEVLGGVNGWWVCLITCSHLAIPVLIYISTIFSIKKRGGAYIGETLGPRRNGRVDSVRLDGMDHGGEENDGCDFTSVTLKTKLAENVTLTAFALITMDNQMMNLRE
jgi:hypothetical protein